MAAAASEATSQAAPYGMKLQLLIPGAKAEAAVKFYGDAFGAVELRRVWYPIRESQLPRIIAAELKIGSSVLLVSDRFGEGAENGAAPPFPGIAIWIETEDADEAVKRALAAGAELVSEVADSDFGDTVIGKVKDPYDYVWVIESVPKIEFIEMDSSDSS
ncbi:uncharacterized protein At5g48480-like [Curcuma longa]|uniref:uncharacterized protein At5g48480-like n=1 Tax=Curcuma longa TaxID=136217 RepID=UPI003D9F4D36